ncbi:MAG TPA: FHA domain-containing protein [Pyrinomonadaceae bacterium]|nr:FHA domain-containing protein [Pyrinomonadaceae bacterium]
MDDKLKIYFYFVFGCIGGLTGWYLSASLLLSTARVLDQALFGAIVGAMIGLAIAAYEGFITRSFVRLFRYGSIGFMLGALAGLIALPISQWLYSRLITTVAGQSSGRFLWKAVVVGLACWILFGGMIGLIEGLNKGTQSLKAFVGGVLGGIIGGGIYELARGSGLAQGASLRQQFILALSLSILGGAIGASIAFVTVALKRAWIEVVDGKFAGRIYDVTKYVDSQLGLYKPGIIGSDEWRANIYLPGDLKVQPTHATIEFAHNAPHLTVLPGARAQAITLVNGREVNDCVLSDGDQLQIGSTLLRYRQKRK